MRNKTDTSLRVLTRTTITFVSICAFLCFLCSIFFVFTFSIGPFEGVLRKPGGYTIGYIWYRGALYLQTRGYGPGVDNNYNFNLGALSALFALAPAIWYATHRRVKSKALRSIRACCAACPIVCLISLDINNNVVPVASLVILIFASVVEGAKRAGRRPTLAERRFRMGLCPSCGYDMRATRDRCPECGVPWPATNSPRKQIY